MAISPSWVCPIRPSTAWSGVLALNPTTADSKTTDGAVSATGAFTSDITGLTPGTLYHVRAYATNTAGTAYGDDVTFTTLQLPTVTTQAVTNDHNHYSHGERQYHCAGRAQSERARRGLEHRAQSDHRDSKTTDGAVSATGAFTSNITGLAPNTLYHVRAYATNAAGTVYGGDVTFTSLSCRQ